MYKIKPLYENMNIENPPTCMYKVRSYYEDQQNDQSQDLLVELNNQQQAQLRRLNRLKEKLNQFCDDLNLTHLINISNPAKTNVSSAPTTQKHNVASSTVLDFSLNNLVQEYLKNSSDRVSKKVNSNSIVSDLVIQVDPEHVPYSLFVLFDQLTLSQRCFIQFFVHGSVLSQVESAQDPQYIRVQNIINLFKSLKLNLVDSRNNYDYGVTFIWKKLKNEKLGPVLNLNGSKQTSIYGEANILRYLSRLLPSAQNYESDKDSIFVDEWINRCTNDLRLHSKPNLNAYLNNLNQYLTKSKFLNSTSNQPNIADLYNWSVITQLLAKSGVKFSNVNDWIKRIEASSSLVKLLHLV